MLSVLYVTKTFFRTCKGTISPGKPNPFPYLTFVHSNPSPLSPPLLPWYRVRLQRLSHRQCNCAIERHPDGEPNERNDIFWTDVLRRIRIPEQRTIRDRLPYERL
jgi:hypothetical protein